MEDPNLIAQIYPYEDDWQLRYAEKTIEMNRTIGKNSRYMPPKAARQEPPKTHLSQNARASTEPPENREVHPNHLPYLELRFREGPRTPLGLVFGTDDTSDIVLPKGQSISRRHFALTYKNSNFDDGFYRLVVRDLGSSFGTQVMYDGEGDELRSNFDWIIDGFRVPNDAQDIIVKLNKYLKFRIVVARHDLASPAYIANVERFRQGTTNPDDLFGEFRLNSGPSTNRNSGAHTPVIKDPIYISMGTIARGGFGEVSREWDVSSGKEYACKRPLNNKNYKREPWVKEINVMKRISHEHIVELCHLEKKPEPALYLEYMPFGNLDDQHKVALISQDECVVILSQSLSALEYLHGQPRPIVHRDIKPENILVKHRDPNHPYHLHIKLSDFGLSKIGGSLRTFCGSWTYCPPEIRDDAGPYTKAVDIWSLGVVLLRFAYSLPYPGSGMGLEWCEKIVEEANSWDSEGLIDILRHMLVIRAEARCSARACWHEASALFASARDRSATPTPASYTAGYRETMDPVPPGGRGGEGQETLHILPVEQYLSGGARGFFDADLDWLSPPVHEGSDALERWTRSAAPPPTLRPSATSSVSSRQSKRRQSTRSRHVESQYGVDCEDFWPDPSYPSGATHSLDRSMPQDWLKSVEESGPLARMPSAESDLAQNVADPHQRPYIEGNSAIHGDFVRWHNDSGVQNPSSGGEGGPASLVHQPLGYQQNPKPVSPAPSRLHQSTQDAAAPSPPSYQQHKAGGTSDNHSYYTEVDGSVLVPFQPSERLSPRCPTYTPEPSNSLPGLGDDLPWDDGMVYTPDGSHNTDQLVGVVVELSQATNRRAPCTTCSDAPRGEADEIPVSGTRQAALSPRLRSTRPEQNSNSDLAHNPDPREAIYGSLHISTRQINEPSAPATHARAGDIWQRYPHPHSRKPKRMRIRPEDKNILEAAYVRNKKPGKEEQWHVAERTLLSKHQVGIWFQNRRCKDRRSVASHVMITAPVKEGFETIEAGKEKETWKGEMSSHIFPSTASPTGAFGDWEAGPKSREAGSSHKSSCHWVQAGGRETGNPHQTSYDGVLVHHFQAATAAVVGDTAVAPVAVHNEVDCPSIKPATTADTEKEPPSHVSTRSIRQEHGIQYIVVRRQRITLRLSDSHLNATEICKLANLNPTERHWYMKQLKKKGVTKKGDMCTWIPFTDGVFLAQALKMDSYLSPLFSGRQLPNTEENYLHKG